MVNDVSRAYFYARAIRKAYVEIAEEDREPGDEDMVGELQYSMYGTREEAQNRQEEFSGMLGNIGLKAGRSSPCIFYHEGRDIRTFVHGGDYVSAGSSEDLLWLRKKFDERYAIKPKYWAIQKEKHRRFEC